MSKLWIVVGDSTTHGGKVVTGSAYTDVDGKPVARITDRVICPKCGPTTIVSGDPTLLIDGQPVARHGDGTSCGATLVAGQQSSASIQSGGGGSPAAAALSKAPAAAPSSRFDEQFRAVDEKSGKPVAGLPYRIELEDGSQVRGVTDAEGHTQRVSTPSPQNLKLFWEPASEQAVAMDDNLSPITGC